MMINSWCNQGDFIDIKISICCPCGNKCNFKLTTSLKIARYTLHYSHVMNVVNC